MRPDKPRVIMPGSAKPGEIIMIRTKIRHVMETGWRKTSDGQTVERNRLTSFSCSFEGQELMRVDIGSGVAQDPYFIFYARVNKPGNFVFVWQGDHEQIFTETVPIEVS